MYQTVRTVAYYVTTVLATALLTGVAGRPAMAQSTGPAGGAGAATTPDQAQPDVSDVTIHKAGAAMRRVTEIRHDYMQRIQATTVPNQQVALRQQADEATVKAVVDHGLTVQQYNSVLRTAMADPNVKTRLLQAASRSQ
jgi:hypothetical protein